MIHIPSTSIGNENLSTFAGQFWFLSNFIVFRSGESVIESGYKYYRGNGTSGFGSAVIGCVVCFCCADLKLRSGG